MLRVSLLLVLLTCTGRGRTVDGSEFTDWSANLSTDRSSNQRTDRLQHRRVTNTSTRKQQPAPAPAPSDTWAHLGNITSESVNEVWLEGHVVPGSVAVLECRATHSPASPVSPGRPVRWFHGDKLIHIGEPTPESRYVSTGTTLLVRDVMPADMDSWACSLRPGHRSPPTRLRVILDKQMHGTRPAVRNTQVQARLGAAVCLVCAAGEEPTPRYRWYRERGDPLVEVVREDMWLWASGAALCLRARSDLAGDWLCETSDALGVVSHRLRLLVDPTLTPLRERRALPGTDLRLGDAAPELHYTFIEQALRAGGDVSLRCAAGGSPTPRLSWLIDGAPLDHFRTQHRYHVSTEVTARGEVVSTLNMTAVTAPDGGRYSCRASNRRGDAEHSARLNIYGPPSIRVLGPVRVVSGDNATVHCPYAGYPISSISWWRRGGGSALGAVGRVSSRDSTLRLTPARTGDAGHYACSVSSPDGGQARRDIEIQVRNPPKISPFMFSSDLTEGSSAQVLCGVSSGDRPMYFSWTKDGAPLPSALQIEEKSLNEFSLLMFSDLTARHSGDYTCLVSNHAATVNFTATLSVKVSPAWVSEPVDAAVSLGAPVMLECAAKGYPIPTVTWYRRIDNEQWDQVGGTWHGAAPAVVEGSGGEQARRGEGEPGVRVQDGTLTARVTTRSHQGVYRCSADNGVGPPLIKNVNLSVHEPANFESSSGNVSCVRGRVASLVCHARGDAPLAVHWTHRGVRLDLDSYRWTVSEVRTDEGLKSRLQLRAAERGDAGEYRCHAHNRYGRSEVLMYLRVEEPPETPSELRLGGVGSRWVQISWRAPRRGDTGEHFSALCTALHSLPGAEPPHAAYNLTLEPQVHDRSDASSSRSLSARLESLRPAAAYSLRLVAGNHVGRSPHSEPLMFTTLEEAPSAPPVNVRVRPAGPGELRVSWSAPAQDSWNGELLGYYLTWRPLGGAGVGEGGGGRVTAPGWSGEEMTLGGLRGGARYAVLLRAYNRAGAGPAAPAVYGAAGPVSVYPGPTPRCEVEGSRALRVRWAPSDTPSPQGYDVYYAPLQLIEPWSGSAEPRSVPAAAPGELLLQGLAPAVNYSVWLRARAPGSAGPPGAQPGPPGPPAHCVTAPEAPGVVTSLRALGAGVDTLLVSWLEPAHTPSDVHYTVHVRPSGAPGAERVLRVEGGTLHGEMRREVRGLRPSLHDVWVEATSPVGRGPPSRAVGAAPGAPGAPHVASFGRTVRSVRGSRVRLACAAVGAEPLRRRWSPAPAPHAVSPTGELTLTASSAMAGDHTCTVRNGLGSDAVTYRVVVVSPPLAPAPRLHRAEPHTLRVTWDPPDDGGAPILGYTVRWMRDGVTGAGEETMQAGPEGAVLRQLACGASYRVTLQAHNALGDSPLSRTLIARTEGEKPRSAPGEEFVWANSTALRLNLLAWRARCAVPTFRLALRRVVSPSPPWTPLRSTEDTAEVGDLQPGAWYEIRAVAISPAGETVALYRAATRTPAGERIGEAVEIPADTRPGRADAAGPATTGTGWRAGVAPALFVAVLVSSLAAIVGLTLVRRRRTAGRERTAPHAQLYTAEPGKRNGEALAPSEGDMNEISPYATFCMSGGGEGAGACAGSVPPPALGAVGAVGGGGGALCELHTFGRMESPDLAAPPPRPNLLSHPEYVRGRESDSESSGSPCVACKHHLYRLPAHRPPGAGAGVPPDTVSCGLESSAEETRPRIERTQRHAKRDQRRRRDPSPKTSVRYFSVARQHPCWSQEPPPCDRPRDML